MKNKFYIIPFLTIALISIFLFNDNVKALESSDLEIEVTSKKNDDFQADSNYKQIAKINQRSNMFYNSNDNTFVMTGYSKSYIVKLSTSKYDISNISIHQVEDDGRNNYAFLSIGDGLNSDDDGYLYAYSDTFILTIYRDDSYSVFFTPEGTSLSNYNLQPSSNALTNRWASSYDMYYKDTLKVAKSFNVISKPDINIHLKEYVKDSNDNIMKAILQVNVSNIDFLKYNYYYKVNEREWVLLDDLNFQGSTFYYNMIENGTFFFKIEDKEDNYINSATFTITSISKYSLNIEDVEYTSTNDEGIEITYHHLLKIPISYFYDYQKSEFQGFQFIFLSKSKDDFTSEFLIKYHNKKNSDGIDIPLQVNFLENLEDFTTIKSESNVGSSGASHTSGGGRHEGANNSECNITKIPYQKTIYNDNSNYYNVLQLTPTNCKSDFNYSIEDFRNDYIYVYYNARIYEDVGSLKEDFEENKENYETNDSDSFFNSVVQALNYFLKPVKEIFKMVTYFFNSLPYQLRFMFIAIFIIGTILIVFRLFF